MLPMIEGQNNLVVINVLTDLLVACCGRMSPDDRRERTAMVGADIEQFFQTGEED